MASQADYENQRRWLSLDLLCGRVTEEHSWHDRMLDAGASRIALDVMSLMPCPPDVIGINHYVTSDRFLDERTGVYPERYRAGNGRRSYADVEAVRVPLPPDYVIGLEARLREAWERYSLPIAVTEAHLACDDPEDCQRWLVDAWTTAKRLRVEGVDLRAVTAWAMFGAVDWRSLLSRHENAYEAGVFDLRDHWPQPTLVAEAVRGYATAGRFDHPALTEPGWWCRPDRYLEGC